MICNCFKCAYNGLVQKQDDNIPVTMKNWCLSSNCNFFCNWLLIASSCGDQLVAHRWATYNHNVIPQTAKWDATCLQTITSLWRNCRYIFKNDFDLQCFCSRLFAQFYINMHLKVHLRLYCNYQRPRQWLPSHDTALVSKGNEYLLLYVWVVYFIKKHSFFHTTTYALYQN